MPGGFTLLHGIEKDGECEVEIFRPGKRKPRRRRVVVKERYLYRFPRALTRIWESTA